MPNRPRPKNAQLIPKNAKLVFKGYMFDVYQWQQQMFNGTFETFEMVRRPDSIHILAIEDDKIILLDEEQPTGIVRKDYLPGGRIDEDEDPLDGAKREMEEETGLRFKDWALLEIVQPAVKIEWFVYVYVAVNKIDQVPTAHESGERISVKRESLAKFKTTHYARLIKELDDVESVEDLLSKVNLTRN